MGQSPLYQTIALQEAFSNNLGPYHVQTLASASFLHALSKLTLKINICRNGTVLLYTIGVGGAAYVYMRVFKGWRLSDLMYVTRSSLTRSLSSVTSGETLTEIRSSSPWDSSQCLPLGLEGVVAGLDCLIHAASSGQCEPLWKSGRGP